MVTVQFSASSSCAIGLPTRIERPTTTASRPARSPPRRAQQHHAAERRAGDEPRQAGGEPAGVERVQPVDVLGRIDRRDDGERVEMRRQRQLHEDAVDRVVGVQLGDELHQLVLGRRLGQDMLEADHADLARRLALAAHVDAARRVVADEHDGEAGGWPTCSARRGDRGGDPLAEAGGIGLAVDDAGAHAGCLLRDSHGCRHGGSSPGWAQSCRSSSGSSSKRSPTRP